MHRNFVNIFTSYNIRQQQTQQSNYYSRESSTDECYLEIISRFTGHRASHRDRACFVTLHPLFCLRS